MRRILLAAAAMVAALSAAAAASACTPVIFTDRETGETYSSGSPEWLRRQQADWRADADTVFIAQAREARMVAGGEIEFMLTPIASVYGGALPDTMLRYRWQPGNTCNPFLLNLTDLVVVYADVDEPFGWSVIGLTMPDQLQDPPADFRERVREVDRGIIRGPALPE
ncbi:MAG: hypothetical protein HYU62_00980 [Caulobacterales bacterium]|nr:hypothetical protein [Caulobacterales bacterium]